MSLPDEATENLLAQPGLDSVEQDANSFDQLSFIGPNYFETPLLPVPMPSLDTIFLRNVRLSAAIGYDAWYRVNQLQPITLTLQLFVDRSNAGISDDIKDTFSYGQMYKEVIGMADGNSFSSMDHLALSVVDLFNNWPGCMIKIRVFAPKSVLRVEGGVTKECVWRRAPADTSLKPHGSLKGHAWMIDSLKIACIIGVNSHERVHKQIVNISLRIIGNLEPAAYHDQIRRAMGCWGPLVNRLCEIVEASSYETLEALATAIAVTALEEYPIPQLGVRVEKPNALVFVEGAGVQIWRDQPWLQSLKGTS